jgi:hypothetical protein
MRRRFEERKFTTKDAKIDQGFTKSDVIRAPCSAARSVLNARFARDLFEVPRDGQGRRAPS